MRFGVLGPLQVVAGGSGAPATVSAARLRALLAALLWRANQPVPVDELAELVWDGQPPRGQTEAARALVMRLRRQLDKRAAARIVTRPVSYSIELSDGELDAYRFEALTQKAGAAIRAGQWTQAVASAAEALGLWRGTPLIDIPSQLLRDRWVPHLEQLHVQALEWRIDGDLHEGRHQQLIGELGELTAQHPLREGFYGQQMLALYRSGRQAEAIAAYRRARDILAAELGVEPGPGLRGLHQRILSADPALSVTGPARSRQTGSHGVTPRELPPAVQGFTGRSAELDALNWLLGRPGQQAPGAVVISAIGGTAGVGKSALAVHWAHSAARRFPDGQLYVNLRGFDPSGTPATPADAIRGFLDALGVPPERIPARPDAQAGLYRSLLADKRMLILLDNARDEHQVRPLLPASSASLVIITSRSQLTGLAAADGARLLSLDVLSHDEAVQLLTARIGAARTAGQPAAVDDIAALCAHLPLALAVAAARAAARPRFPLIQLAAELRCATGRLDALDADDPAASVRAVFSWSYQQLSPAAARMFRLLGLHPGPDIGINAAASLAAASMPEARRLLHELARDCLITEHAPARYAFHDLLRAYAADQARKYDSQADRDAAADRILDHYLHTAAHGAMLWAVCESVTLTPPAPGTSPEQPADHRQAMAWFDAEHHTLLAAVAFAAESGADRHVWQLAWAITTHLFRRGYVHELATMMDAALAAATRLDDPLGQAVSLRQMGNAFTTTGQYDHSRAYLERCLPLYQRLGDRRGEALAHLSIAILAETQGRYADALAHNEEALLVARAIGHEQAQARALANVAWCLALLGDYQRAREFCDLALTLLAKAGGREYHVWDTLGYIEHHLGDFAQAAAHFERALEQSRDHGDRLTEGSIQSHAGDARHDAGELSQAREAWQQALAIYDDLQHPDAGKLRTKLASTAATQDTEDFSVLG
jgi:DNA-binding SARP family transcriptional activator/tetratricopeptide (TPR) repeat protein